jgi:hypothetical protein
LARTRSPASLPQGRSPDRYLRRGAQFSFGEDGRERMSWRELVLPERALKARGLER